MDLQPKLIVGGTHTDERGKLTFVNDFLMDKVVRLYSIEHPATTVIRAWQAHRIENKWFYVVSGGFKIVTVKVDNWKNPSQDLDVAEHLLDEHKPQILHVPGGYANGFQALIENSKLLIFSDFSAEQSRSDDFRFDKNLWYNW